MTASGGSAGARLRTPASSSSAARSAPVGEQVAVDEHQAVESWTSPSRWGTRRVVVADRGAQASTAAASRSPARGTRRASRGPCAPARPPSRGRRSSRRVDRAGRVGGSGCTRLTTSPPNGIPASRSLSRKKIASATGSRSGEVTIRNVVAGSASSALTPAARSRKPSNTAASAAKKTFRSFSRSTPVRRPRTLKTTDVPRPTTRAASPVGASRTRSARPSRKPVSRSGASRKSSALRDGGVSSTITSKRPRASQLIELGDRGELLRPGHRARQLAVDPVPRISSRRAPRRAPGARSARRTSAWGRASSPTARRLSSIPWPANRAASTRRGSEPSCSMPSASASRRAGSIVTTHDPRAPRGQPHGDRRRGGGLAHAARARADAPRACREPVDQVRGSRTSSPPRRASAGPSSPSAVKTKGSVRTGVSPTARRSRASCERCAFARAASARAARAARDGGAASSATTSAPRNRCGSTPLTTTAASGCPAAWRKGVAQRERLVDRHLLGPATATTAVFSGSASIAWIRPPWRATGPRRAASANVPGAVSTATPWPVAGASRITRS